MGLEGVRVRRGVGVADGIVERVMRVAALLGLAVTRLRLERLVRGLGGIRRALMWNLT